jgi:S1-C subfamily serine protease
MRHTHNTLGFSFKEFASRRSKADQLQLIHGAKSCSSGALVGRNLVLTANHTVNENESAKILFKNIVLEAVVVKRLPEIDVMLLAFDDSTLIGDVPSLDFGFSTPRLGEKCYSTGYPLGELVGFNPVFYSFEVSRLKVDRKPPFFQFNSEVSKGCSGMPVVNDRLEVLGVVNSKASGVLGGESLPSNWGFATKSQYFKESIQKYLPLIHMRPKPRLSSEAIAKKLNKAAVVVLACSISHGAHMN